MDANALNTLKAHFVLHGASMKDVSKALGISRTALYRKMSGKSEFSRKEIQSIIKKYGIDEQTAFAIFFSDKVS